MLMACGNPAPEEESQREGERVAVVNGEVILARDVEAWGLENTVDQDAALEALIDEALLVSEARRRGTRSNRDVVRRAAVQEILMEIELAVPASDVTSEAIEREYETTTAQLAETNPDVVLPSLEGAADEIRMMLVGRARLARLERLLQAPELNEERVANLLALPAID